MSEDKSAKKREKMPTALKRELQAEKKRLANRSFRSKVHTAVRSIEQSLSQKEEKSIIQQKLDLVFSLMDKGVKKKVYKVRTAARAKSRLNHRCNTLTSV